MPVEPLRLNLNVCVQSSPTALALQRGPSRGHPKFPGLGGKGATRTTTEGGPWRACQPGNAAPCTPPEPSLGVLARLPRLKVVCVPPPPTKGAVTFWGIWEIGTIFEFGSVVCEQSFCYKLTDRKGEAP